MNLTTIEMLDFPATPTEFEKCGGIVMATNIPSLRDWNENVLREFRVSTKFAFGWKTKLKLIFDTLKGRIFLRRTLILMKKQNSPKCVKKSSQSSEQF